MNSHRVMPSFALDQKQTIENIISALSTELRPIHYREAYGRFLAVSRTLASLGEKTDGAEKVRQWFSESSRGVFVDSGHLYLAGWLDGEKDQLFRSQVEGKRLTAQNIADCMYESGRRHDYMLDKSGKANTEAGVKDRQRRAKIEWSIAGAFRERFTVFYREPKNAHNFKLPCDHDFALDIGGSLRKFDVKEFTRQTTTIITDIKPEVTYVFGEWRDDRAMMIGYIPGSACEDLRDIPLRRRTCKEAQLKDLAGVETLIVWLNMRLRGESLNAVRQRYIERLEASKAA